MSRRIRRLWPVLLIVPVLALSACTADPSGGGSSGSSDDVTLWHKDGDSTMPQLVAKYNSVQSKVHITETSVPDDQYLLKLSTAVRSGDQPDIVGFDMVDGQVLAANGVLKDISSEFNSMPGHQYVNQVAIDSVTYQGKIYAVTPTIGSSQLIWNKDLFRKAGLDPDKPPSNLAEVKSDAEAISALGPDYYGFTTLSGLGGPYTMFPSIWADGGDFITPSGPNQKTDFANDPAVTQDLLWAQSMWDEGLLPPQEAPNQDPYGQSMELLDTGHIGIAFTGAWAVVDTDASKIDWGYAPGIPGMDGKMSGFLGGNGYGITAGSTKTQEAWDFLNWCMNDPAAIQIIVNGGETPGNMQIAQQWMGSNPDTAPTLGAIEVAQFCPSVSYQAIFNDANGPWMTAAQKIIFQHADPHQALSEADTVSSQILSDAYGAM